MIIPRIDVEIMPLIVNASNWCINETRLADLKQSIQARGLQSPIEIVNGVLEHGRMRCLAMHELGHTHICARFTVNETLIRGLLK